MQPARIRTRGRPEPWLLPARVVDNKGIGIPGRGRPIPSIVQKILQPFYHFPLKRVRVHQGIPQWLARRAAVSKPAAMSYKYDIYVAPGYADLKIPSGWKVLIHELRHVEQYHRVGPKMYRNYGRYTAREGYWKNPYEKDAYSFERKVAHALAL